LNKFKSIFDFSLIETKYFWIAIVIIGTIGIWLPLLLGSNIQIGEVPILFTTYYISIYFAGCLNSVINKIKSIKNPEDNESVVKGFLDSIYLIVGALALVLATILFNNNDYHFIALSIAIFGTFISLSLWWKNNWEGKTYDQKVRDEVNNNHGNSW